MVHLLSDIVARDEELQVVGTACNGEEAYKMIKTKEPDVVLLDIVMPKLDGLGVIDKVKKDKTLKKFDQCNRSGACDGGCLQTWRGLLHNEAF